MKINMHVGGSGRGRLLSRHLLSRPDKHMMFIQPQAEFEMGSYQMGVTRSKVI